MEIIEQNIEIKHKNLTKANYLYVSNFMKSNKKAKNTQYGYQLAKVKSREKNYLIVIDASDTFEFEISENRHLLKYDDLQYEFDEIYINGLDKFLIYAQEANIRIINEDDPDEIVFLFDDYSEALEYLKILDTNKS